MRKRSQSGFSLLENVVAIAVVSTVLLGIIGGFMTTTRVSARVGDAAAAEATLTGVAERLPELPYRTCATLAQARAALATLAPPPPYRVVLTDIAYLDDGGSFRVTCQARDAGAQRWALAVTVDGADVRADGQVVHRNPGARP